MKKNLVLILCLSLIFILVGCNSDKKANKSIQADFCTVQETAFLILTDIFQANKNLWMDGFVDYGYILYYIKNMKEYLWNYQYIFKGVDNLIIGGL